LETRILERKVFLAAVTGKAENTMNADEAVSARLGVRLTWQFCVCRRGHPMG